MENFRRYLSALLLLSCFMTSGCAITLGPEPVQLKESTKSPIFRLDKISEKYTGEWPSGGIRNYVANAFNQPAASSIFTKDDSGLSIQIDLTSHHDDDGPRLVGLGLLSMATIGIIPLHYHSVWPVTCDVTIRAEDGTVQGSYSLQSAGVYDIWTFPLTMFSLFGASMRGNEDGQAVLQRTANDIVSQVLRSVDADYPKYASVYRRQMLAKADRAPEAPAEAGLREIKSDVDEMPAAKVKPSSRSYAIVIGVERYRQKLPRADFATHDARTVTEYLTKVLGYPEENVVTLLNDKALKSDFEKYFEKWLANNVENGSTVFVYYSGHGAPNPRTGDAYLVPFDGDPTFIDETGYSLKRMYAALGSLPAQEVIVALDACFSGVGGRSVIAKGARSITLNLKDTALPSRNMTVLAAASGDQMSSTYDDKGHGLFTYYFLKGIKHEDVVAADGSLRLDDLFAYLQPQVERVARKQYNNEQTPQLIAPAILKN